MMISTNMSGHGTKRRARKLGSIERDVLNELSLGDLLYGFLLSARSTSRFYKLARDRAASRYRSKKAIERLIEMEYVHSAGERLSITNSGRDALGIAVSETFNYLANKKWDHKWRIVTFDIPEKYAALRNKVRDVLKQAGFVK